MNYLLKVIKMEWRNPSTSRPAGQSGTASIGLISSVIGNNSIGSGGVNSPDVSGTLISFGYNHIENTAGGTFTLNTGDITGIDPGLGALALNGGSTLNYQPMPAVRSWTQSRRGE